MLPQVSLYETEGDLTLIHRGDAISMQKLSDVATSQGML